MSESQRAGAMGRAKHYGGEKAVSAFKSSYGPNAPAGLHTKGSRPGGFRGSDRDYSPIDRGNSGGNRGRLNTDNSDRDNNTPAGQFQDVPQGALDYMNPRDTIDSSDMSPPAAPTETPTATEDADTRNPFDIHAVKDGEVFVIKINDDNDYGNRIYIKHDDGSVTMYAHLDSVNSSLSVGDRVEGGQVLGEMGNTGTEDKHLHFSYFAPGVTAYGPENATDGTNFINDGGHQPANTTVSNVYGSPFRHPSLDHHEGTDYSGKIENLRSGWETQN